MDRGIVSEKNLVAIRKRGGQYLVGTPLRQMNRFEAELLKDDWTQVRANVEVKQIAIPQGEETYILCRTGCRKEKEKAIRKRFSLSMEKALQALEKSIASGRLKDQKEERVKAHVLVAFLGYALWVTLKHLLQRRPAIGPQSSADGLDNAQPFSPMKALALLSTLQSADIVLPTTDGREIHLRRITEPTAEQKSLLHRLGLSLPERLKSTAKCSADFATA